MNEGAVGVLLCSNEIPKIWIDNGNFDNVYVPKMAEEAVMASILYNLSKIRPSAAGASALYKKEAFAKMRNAKIRISNMKM